MVEFLKKYKKYCSIIAYILIIVSCVLISNIVKKNLYEFQIQGLYKAVEDISVNLTLDDFVKNKEGSNILACFDTYCKGFYLKDDFNGYYSEFNDKYIVDNVKIKLPKPITADNIDSIYIYTGSTSYHYNKDKIKTFDVKEDKDSVVLSLPKINNYTGTFNHFCVLFLSLFYNAEYFILPYILLFIAFLIFWYEGRLKIKPRLIIPIVLIGILLRLNHFTYVPLWIDELYTKQVALESFKATFSDPGNPPLFFVLTYIVTKIFSDSVFWLRFVSLVAGILTIPVVWLLFKDISKNFALFASFMVSINSILIYRSQDARAYSLDMFLIVLAVYFLFKFLENPNKKNIIYNAIMTALLINTNYFLILVAAGNVLWGLIFSKANKLKYFIANCVAGLTLVPYLLISFKEAISADFNSYIVKPSKATFDEMVHFYFLNDNLVAIFVFFVILINLALYFIIPKKTLKNKYYKYLFYIVNFTIICATLISLYIKPMMYTRNILAIYSLFFLLLISSSYPILEIKNKLARVLLSLYIIPSSFFVIHMTYHHFERCQDNISEYMQFVAADAPKYHEKNYEIHAILPHVVPDISSYSYLEDYKYIKWHNVTMGTSKSRDVKKENFTSKPDKVVIYVPLINIEYFVISDLSKLRVVETNYLTNGKIVY